MPSATGVGDRDTVEGSFSVAQHRRHHHTAAGTTEEAAPLKSPARRARSSEAIDPSGEDAKKRGISAALARMFLGGRLRSKRRITSLCLLTGLVTFALRSRLNGGAPSIRTRNAKDVDALGSSAADSGPLSLIALKRYGTRPRLGTSTFVDSPTCRSLGLDERRRQWEKEGRNVAQDAGDDSIHGPCVAHFPAFDLSEHVTVDEATEKMPVFADLEVNAEMGAQQKPDQPKVNPPKRIVGSLVALPKDGGDKSVAVALLTRRGYGLGHEVNQDRAIVVSPYAPLDSQVAESTDFVMGIFDGHGTEGHATAHYASTAVPRLLASTLGNEVGKTKSWLGRKGAPTDDEVKRALVSTFLEVDKTVPDLPTSGCTASVALRLGQKVYVANVGDSLTFVVSYDLSSKGARIVYRSRLDKPHLPEERARIERMGGQVYLPPPWITGDSSRVLAPVEPGAEGFMMETYGLAMSRSFGDKEVAAVGVVAEPIVDVIDISDLRRRGAGTKGDSVELFVVAATDGLFDRVPPEDIASRLAKSLYGGDSKDPPLVACEELIFKASGLWLEAVLAESYRDDITIAVSRIT